MLISPYIENTLANVRNEDDEMIRGDLLSDNAKHCAKHPSVRFPTSPVTRQLPLNLKPVTDKVNEEVKIRNGGGNPYKRV